MSVPEINHITHFVETAARLADGKRQNKTITPIKKQLDSLIEFLEQEASCSLDVTELKSYLRERSLLAREYEVAFSSEYHGGMAFAFEEILNWIIEREDDD